MDILLHNKQLITKWNAGQRVEVTHSAHDRGQVFPAQVEKRKRAVAGHIPDVGAEALCSCGQNKNTVRFGCGSVHIMVWQRWPTVLREHFFFLVFIARAENTSKKKKERKTNYNWNRCCTGQTAKVLFTACPRSYTDITVNDLWPFRYEMPLCYFILLGSCVEFCCNLVIYWPSWGHTPNCLTTNPPEIHTSAFLGRLKKVSKMLSVPTALFFSVWSGSRRSTNCHILCNLIQFY